MALWGKLYHRIWRRIPSLAKGRVLQNRKPLHRKDAKNAKKDKNKKEDAVFAIKSAFLLPFSLLCVLCVFAVQIFLILQHPLAKITKDRHNSIYGNIALCHLW
jgi:hypothetical protein